MSKPKTSQLQFDKTQSLLREVEALSARKLADLFRLVDSEIPGIVSDQSHFRQLANGHRFLTDAMLAKFSGWALQRNWGGDQARAARAYIPPTDEEVDALESAKRHEKYLQADPIERVVNGPMRATRHEQNRTAAMLNSALSDLSPSGFSHADILYMVHSWLIKNKPTCERGIRQSNIVLADFSDVRGLDSPVFPNSLPINFSMDGDRDGQACYIECKITRPWGSFELIPPDVEQDECEPEE